MKVFLDHDGGVDDFIAQIILSTDPGTELVGISVIDADCFVNTAYDVSCRLLSLLNCDKVPIAKSTLKGVHPFPTSWRRHCESCFDFPSLNTKRIKDAEAQRVHLDTSGQQLLVDIVKASPEPVTIVVTGPMTNIAWALDNDPKFHHNVKEVVVMGGAIDVDGNVVNEPNHDGSAEWNVYYDAPSFHRALNSPLRLILFPLDATNTVPISRDFVRRFGEQNEYLASQFVGNAYAMCSFDYFAWDALTAAFAVRPQLCSLEEVPITVVLESPQERPEPIVPSHPHSLLCILLSLVCCLYCPVGLLTCDSWCPLSGKVDSAIVLA
jgi:purine nucleosidase